MRGNGGAPRRCARAASAARAQESWVRECVRSPLIRFAKTALRVTQNQGFMDGAVESGKRVAGEIAAARRSA